MAAWMRVAAQTSLLMPGFQARSTLLAGFSSGRVSLRGRVPLAEKGRRKEVVAVRAGLPSMGASSGGGRGAIALGACGFGAGAGGGAWPLAGDAERPVRAEVRTEATEAAICPILDVALPVLPLLAADEALATGKGSLCCCRWCSYSGTGLAAGERHAKGRPAPLLGVAGTEEERDTDCWGTGRGAPPKGGSIGEVWDSIGDIEVASAGAGTAKGLLSDPLSGTGARGGVPASAGACSGSPALFITGDCGVTADNGAAAGGATGDNSVAAGGATADNGAAAGEATCG